MPHQTPHASDLTVGDHIHPDQPPTCCGHPMGYYGIHDLSTWECGTCRRGLGTDTQGTITCHLGEDMETELHGMRIDPGDHIGNEAPDCCEQEMDRGVDKRGHRTWTCSDCGTVVEVDKSGLISDIR